MEPEVHIIDKYFQEIYHCCTMTNIKCNGGKEIDLLAINPITNLRYHIESRVSVSFQLKDKATYILRKVSAIRMALITLTRKSLNILMLKVK